MPARLPLPAGIVEGFYGPPWSHEDRLSMIKFLGEQGFNQYCYGPKDDPWHRDQWREPYPADAFARIGELIAACAGANVDFIYALHPGFSITYSDPRELQLILEKYHAFASAGVRHFALFLDDVPPELPTEEDKAEFGSFARAHALLCNRAFEGLRQFAPDATLVMCPTEYYTNDRTPYLAQLGAELHPDISMIWTGVGVCAPTIQSLDCARIRAVIGRKPVLWDNFPVNDYVPGHLLLGPLLRRTPALGSHLTAYWSNPMNEAAASKIPLKTIADFLRNPHGYDPHGSHKSAIAAIAVSAAGPVAELAAFASGSFLEEDEAPEFVRLAAEWLASPSADTRTALDAALAPLLDLPERLRAASPSPGLLRDLWPAAKRLRQHARNLKAAVALAHEEGSARAKSLRTELLTGLRTLDTVEADLLANSAPAEYQRIRDSDDLLVHTPIADDLFGQIQEELHRRDRARLGLLTADAASTAPHYAHHFPASALDDTSETYFRTLHRYKRGHTFHVDFVQIIPAGAEIRIDMAPDPFPEEYLRSAAAEVSTEGTKWSKQAELTERSHILCVAEPFRYLRLRILEDQHKRVTIARITVSLK